MHHIGRKHAQPLRAMHGQCGEMVMTKKIVLSRAQEVASVGWVERSEIHHATGSEIFDRP
jgi:hypothetical protein